MISDAPSIADGILRQAEGSTRFLVAIAGPPGSGKSTFADELASDLRSRGELAAIVPMDGFHMDDAVLREKGLLSRKGAPLTFDVRGLVDVVRALRRTDDEVLVPLFDRTREQAIAGARAIDPQDRFVIVEGNYLLLDEPGWEKLAHLFDWTIMLLPPEEVLEERLMRRWLDLGLDADAARAKVADNDLPNGRLVRMRSSPADVTLS
ncbi:nucleoside triphosphate hydrolase [Pseudorhizobium marinum]|uniref:nucleoside triphosphate hydrolase n=1 Tax=Pseudorhizobium marinum TaxID=1496690 RepID=UPI000497C9EF|nr:nucleoside triphosphate hydrolase [Pseudorhizobium marinum]